jgi:hypothetical protein
MDDAARLSRMSQFNIDLVEERFFSKKRYKLVAIDHETAVFNRCLPAKANVFDVKETEIEPHGSMIIIYCRAWPLPNSRRSHHAESLQTILLRGGMSAGLSASLPGVKFAFVRFTGSQRVQTRHVFFLETE